MGYSVSMRPDIERILNEHGAVPLGVPSMQTRWIIEDRDRADVMVAMLFMMNGIEAEDDLPASFKEGSTANRDAMYALTNVREAPTLVTWWYTNRQNQDVLAVNPIGLAKALDFFTKPEPENEDGIC